MGLALGLLGSGGSILTVPILVYLLGQEEKTAIAGSLAIVGAIALIGGTRAAVRRRVDWRSVFLFGIPGMAGTVGGAWLAHFVSGELQLAVFALFMLGAAGYMLRRGPAADGEPRGRQSPLRLAVQGIGVGVATGFVGIGGGFLIVPALVLVGGLPMHLAIGTSLMIISINAFTGFFRYLPALAALGLSLDWRVIVPFVLVGGAGSLVGGRLGASMPQRTLRRIFGFALIGIGLLVLAENLHKLLQ